MGALKNLTEKTVLVNILQGDGVSEKFDLTGAKIVSVQATVDVENTAKTADSGTAEVEDLTFPAKASLDPSEYLVVWAPTMDTPSEMVPWAIYFDTTGSDPEPTGAIWEDIPAQNKAVCDVSGETTDVEVAAAAVAALDGINGFDTMVTLVDNTDGSVTATQMFNGLCTNAQSLQANDSGAGNVTVAVTTPGVASAVNVTESSFVIPAHGWVTGMKVALTDSGTAPSPLSNTNYWTIVLDADNIQLATSLSNAEAGTFVVFTNQGSSANVTTLTPEALSGGTLKLQQSNSNKENEAAKDADMAWSDMTASQNITVDGVLLFTKTDPECRWGRILGDASAGTVSLICELLIKGEQA